MVAGSLKSGDEVDFSGKNDISKWYRYNVLGNSNQVIVTHTFNYGGKVLRNYTMLYDKTKKAALWAAFVMNADIYPWNETGSKDWNYDPAIEQSWQPKLANSYGGGYTRGHQVASNDRRATLYQMDYYSNMTPQTQECNSSSSSDWDDIEASIQNLGKNTTGSDMLYVVTGAIFDSGYKTDATDNNGVKCPVPTRYYKCIMLVKYKSSGEVDSATGAAFVINHETLEREDLTIDQVEEITKFDFFTNIPLAIQNQAEGNFTKFF